MNDYFQFFWPSCHHSKYAWWAKFSFSPCSVIYALGGMHDCSWGFTAPAHIKCICSKGERPHKRNEPDVFWLGAFGAMPLQSLHESRRWRWRKRGQSAKVQSAKWGAARRGAPKDFTKPRQTLQSPRKTIESPDRLYKASIDNTKPRQTIQRPKPICKTFKILDEDQTY